MAKIQPGIHRGELDFEKGFVRAPNEWMRDPSISLKAKGLLMYFLSHKIGYVIALSQIERETADGSTSIRSAITELQKAGYLVVGRTTTERGWNAGLSYMLQDPEFRFQEKEVEPEPQNPTLENPTLENPTLENPNALEEQSFKKTNFREEQNTQNKKANARKTKSEKLKEAFETFWEIYPRHEDEHPAYKAFVLAVQEIDLETLNEAARRYRDDPNRVPGQYTRKAANWLTDKAWNNGPLPERNLSFQEQLAIKDKKLDAQSEASRESARRAIAEATEAKAYAKANPAPRCEHNRIAVICDTCNKKTARIKTQQLEG